MRKIIASEMVSVDGYFAGADGNIGWHVVDDEFNKYAIELMKSVDTIMFGRVTYDMFESYWPKAAADPATSPDDVIIANWIDDAKKIVFSKSLEKTDWKNTTLLHEVVPEEILKIKQQEGKDIVIYGSGSIVSALTKLGLIDEYKLIVAPVVLGSGRSLFANIKEPFKLKLLDESRLGANNVILSYELAK